MGEGGGLALAIRLGMRVCVGHPGAARSLLEEHLACVRAISPCESCHALDLEGLTHPSITFWIAVDDAGTAMACGALREMEGPPRQGEIKSMRTGREFFRRGLASRVLEAVIDEARRRGYARLSLETGSQEYFAPARALYARFGFEVCEAFGEYRKDPNSVFMSISLVEGDRSNA